MRSLQNKSNVQPPSAIYPEGRIKDDDGSGNGTPVNEAVYGDFHQFFARLLVEAGITPNEIAENAYDGFQSILALYQIIANKSTNDPAISFTNAVSSFGSNWSSGTDFGFRKTRNGTMLQMKGSVVCTSTPSNGNVMFILPAGFRPAVSRFISAAGIDSGGTIRGYQIQINASGNVIINQIGASTTFSGSTNFTIYLDGLEVML